MSEHPNHPWQIVAPALVIGVPVIVGAVICIYAQIKWDYSGPNNAKAKDHEDQHEGGIKLPVEDQTVESTAIELIERPRSLTHRTEEDLEDPDAITALPPIQMV